MNIQELCRRGFFDKVTINFVTEPIYGDDIAIFNDLSFAECTNNELNFVDNSIFKVRINILGVEQIQKQICTPAELSKDKKRGALLYKVGVKNDKSFLLAYADLIIVRDGDRSHYELGDKFANELDKSLLVNNALKIQNKQGPKERLNNIVIVDKVYVYEQYRGCHISTWLHENIREIVYRFMGMPIGDMLLIPGDFADEARNKFGMSNDDYVHMLKSHYETLGYKMQKNGLMINRLVPKNTVISKISTALQQKIKG